MSIPVELQALAEQVERFGPTPYLVTVNPDGRPHAVSVHVGWRDDALVLRAGRRTVSNAAERPAVTLLWAPVDDEAFSLIVDGTAVVDDDRVVVRPTTSVLHRQAAAGPEDAPQADCVAVFNH